MRTALAALTVTLLASCSDGASQPTPQQPPPDPPPPSDEVPHAEVELLVQRFQAGGPWSWYTMAPDGSRVEPFVGIPQEVAAAVPSPDGRTLALVRSAELDGNLWLMDRWSRALTPLLTGDFAVHEVSWSPDGQHLAVSFSDLSASEDILVMNRDGSGRENLTPDPLPATVADRGPAWSPGGATIAFSSNRTGRTRLWLMNHAGGHLRAPLAEAFPDAIERAPAWSPDGARLAFQAARFDGDAAEMGIGIARPDGTGYRLFPLDHRLANVAWSPDGRIVYAAAVAHDWELHALDPETGEVENLTHHLLHDVAARPLRRAAPPAWAGFAAPVAVDAGAENTPALTAADVDGDGDLDLAAISTSHAGVALLLNDGHGAFTPMGHLESVEGARTLASADLNRDGFEDLVVGGPTGLLLYRGSAGGPGLAEVRTLEGQILALGTGDFGLDGPVELSALVRGGRDLSLHAQLHGVNVEDTFQFLVDAPLDLSSALTACTADATGEGWQDLVVLLAGPGASVAIVPGQGPSFLAPYAVAGGLGLNEGDAAACADLDGDRRADLAIVRPGGALRVLLAGQDAFGPPAEVGAGGTAVAAADLDRDGDVDLVVADPRGALRFHRNLGDGRFAAPVTLAEVRASRVVAADLDGDGWLDLAVADAEGGIRILRNRGGAPG
ncbi:MAG: FG-GAP-like repeat-containing protein [Anaeromyxobacteraceae bacterium]